MHEAIITMHKSPEKLSEKYLWDFQESERENASCSEKRNN